MQPIQAAIEAAPTTKGKPTCRTRGPYEDRNKFRLTFIEGNKTWSEIFQTRAAALAAQRAFEKKHAAKEALTVAGLVEKYLEHHVRKGSKPRSISHYSHRLLTFLGHAGLLARAVPHVTPEVARASYEAYATRQKARGDGVIAVASQQTDLRFVRLMFEWAVEEKLVTENPFNGVRPVGRPNRGKQQLSRDQAARFLEVALELTERNGDVLALAAAIVVGTGARNSEVMCRRVRDVDEGGEVLRISRAKTDKSNRPLAVPSACVPFLSMLAASRPADALLFLPECDLGKPEPKDKSLCHRLLRKVKSICLLAGVDVVVVHSFRGLYATLGVASTGDRDLIARQLGHASARVTERNYIDNRVAGVAQQRRLQERLGLGRVELPSGRVSLTDLTHHLDALTEALDVKLIQGMLQHLISTIASKAALQGPAARSKPRVRQLSARSESNTEQVGGSLRNLSAAALIRPISDGN